MNNQLPEDGTIPSFLLCTNPAVAAARADYHSRPMPPALSAVPFEKTEPESDPDLATYLAGEAERERIAKENALAKLNGKKATESKAIQGGRFDTRRNKWITPEEDFIEMAAKARRPDGSTVSVDELRAALEDAAKLPISTRKNPKTGKDEPTDCCPMFAKRILGQLDAANLALENKKALDRAKRRAAYAKKHGKVITVKRRAA